MTNQTNRAKWDIGRLIKTLAFFDIIPFLSCLVRIFQGHTQENKNTSTGGSKVGVILVAGATGGVGKRVVKRLVERGYKVRVLVRDAIRAKEILGDNL